MTSLASPSFQECKSVEEYVAFCLSNASLAAAIPILARAERHRLPSERSDRQTNGQLDVDWASTAEAVRQNTVSRLRATDHFSGNIEIDADVVVASEGLLSIFASLVGGYSGLPVLVVKGDCLTATLKELSKGHSTIAVVSRADATDDRLIRILELSKAQASTLNSTASLPSLSVITGRDDAAVSWMVGKIISQLLRTLSAKKRPKRLMHFVPLGESVLGTSLTVTGDLRRNKISFVRERLNRTEVLEKLKSPAFLIAYHSHGSDACANAGAGVVLCGLNAERHDIRVGGGGVLACGDGYSCPRGPRPLPLSEMHTHVIFIGGCNGLRLASSVLHSDFSLPLAYVDGPGLAYIGAISGHAGGEICSLLFSALIASGRSAQQSVVITNAFLLCSGLDRPVYCLLGLTCEKKTPNVNEPRDSRAIFVTNGIYELNCRRSYYCEAVIVDSPGENLAVCAQSDLAGSPIYWFTRKEHNPARNGSSEAIRIHFFRFPESLGKVRFHLYDRADVESQYLRSLDGLRRWLTFWRCCGLSVEQPREYNVLWEIERDQRECFAMYAKRLRYDTTALEYFRKLLTHTDLASSLARNEVTERFVPQISGPFWLTNTWMPFFEESGSTDAECCNCGGVAFTKTFTTSQSKDVRLIIDCLRCGIVCDERIGSDSQQPRIDAPGTVKRGSRFSATISFRAVKKEQSVPINVWAALTTYENRDIPVVPQVSSHKASQKFKFSFDVPEDALPHGYAIKALIFSGQDVAFASRLLFIN